MIPQLLDNQVAWVTGAGRGLGAAIARGLAQAGARVCITDVNADELAATAAEIDAAVDLGGSTTLALLTDVCDAVAMQESAARIVERWGRVDILVSNAAILPLAPFEAHTPAFWRKMIDVNLTGVYHGVWAVWPYMVRQRHGHCIAIASGASVRGFVDEVAYCAAKHGLEGFTQALALEASAHQIAVNTMGPGRRIKPTSVSRDQEAQQRAAGSADWCDALELAPAFVWLAAQPPDRYTGLRFDAGPIASTLANEGYDFSFAPEKVTLYVQSMQERLARAPIQ